MNVYQGEPLNFKLTIKDDTGAYLPSLSGLTLEALIKNSYDNVTIKTWSTAGSTITIGTYTEEGTTIGYASFGLTASETKNLCGDFSMELAKVLADGRAIGLVIHIVRILPSNIKNGVQ